MMSVVDTDQEHVFIPTIRMNDNNPSMVPNVPDTEEKKNKSKCILHKDSRVG